MQKQFDRLDHLVSVRGLAAWLVVFYHSIAFLQSAFPGIPPQILTVVRHGDLAVDFFFVLSGFIIFINYFGSFSSPTIRIIFKFYWTRFTRIYPVHFVMILAYLCLAGSFMIWSSSQEVPSSFGKISLLENVFLVQAWKNNDTSWNVPSWSISAEWFVYLLFPGIAVTITTYFRSAFSVLLTSFVIVSVAGIAGWLDLEINGMPLYAIPLARVLHEFILGTLIGTLYIHYRPLLIRLRPWLILILIGFTFLAYVWRAPLSLTVPTVCFLTIAFLSVDDSWLTKFLKLKWLIFLGEISYSTYMVHYFVRDVFKALFARSAFEMDVAPLIGSFFVVLLLSCILYRWVELPAQSFLRNLRISRSQRVSSY